MNVTLETRGFDAGAARLAKRIQAAKPALVTSAARAFIFRVIPLTPAASPTAIEAELRAAQRGGRGIVGRAALAVQLRRRGRNPRDLAAGAFTAAVEDLIRRRRESAGFLRAGWLAAGRSVGIAAVPGVKLFTAGLGRTAPTFGGDFQLVNLAAADVDHAPTIAEARRAMRIALDAAARGLGIQTLERVAAEALQVGLR